MELLNQPIVCLGRVAVMLSVFVPDRIREDHA